MDAAWFQADDDARERYRPWIELGVAETTDDIRAKYELQIQEKIRARLKMLTEQSPESADG
jgi:hypothetical protein